MPHGQKNQNIKQKQYCNKFKKDFKNGPHQKNLKKKNFKKDDDEEMQVSSCYLHIKKLIEGIYLSVSETNILDSEVALKTS